MSALAKDHRPNVATPAPNGSSGHVMVTSTRKLVAVIVAVEFAYACALAIAIPYGTVAVGIVIAVTCLLAIWIRGRLDRGTVRARRVRGESRSA
jgi:hypothetical protein